MNSPSRQARGNGRQGAESSHKGRGHRMRARRRQPGSWLEILEDRRLLATLDIGSIGGALTYSAGAGLSSALTVSIDPSDTADLIFSDGGQTITLTGAGTAGWTGGGTNTVTGPTSSFSSMTIGGSTTLGQALTIDYTNGDPLPASGLTFTPTTATGPAANALTLTSGAGGTSFLIETYAAKGAGAGTITYSDSANTSVPITFSNLSPVTDTVPSPTLIFNAPATATKVDIVDHSTDPAVPVGDTEINDGGTSAFELIDFANKIAVTANVNVAGATTTIDTATASAALTTLDVNSGAGSETVDVESTPSGVTTTTDTGSPAGSTTTVGLSGLLTSILGPVTVQSTGGSNKLVVDDSAEPTPQAYTIDNSVITATSMPSTITLGGTGITTLNLDSSGGSVVNLGALTQGGVTTYNFTGGISLGANTLNVVSDVATLDFATAGTITFGAGEPTINYTNTQTVNVVKPATPPSGTSTTIAGTAGQALNNVVVATFTDPDLDNITSAYVASINWGDATAVSPGMIMPLGMLTPGGPYSYEITGSHTYAASGTYTVAVTLTDQGTSGSATVSGTTINVTSHGPVGSVPAPIDTTATISPAPAAPLIATGVPVTGIEGNPLTTSPNGVLVATFQDTGTPGAPSSYSASINWGDGSTSTGAITITSQGMPNGVVYSVYGNHTYAETGTDPITVTITNTANGAKAIASSQAVIADAALSPSGTQPTVTTTEEVAFSGAVASFTDANPSAPITDYNYVMIYWGDGTAATAGTISQPGGVGTTFYVSGSHTYADAGVNGGIGHYTITVDVSDVDGASTTITNTANVADVPLVVTGMLNPASDSGVSDTDDITNVVQPNFLGATNQPDATVSLYATASGSTTPVLIGAGTSDSSGAWSITAASPFANGAYAITAVAVDSSGHTTSTTTTIVPDLVIDTVGPKVTSVVFNRSAGQIVVTFQDYGGPGNAGVGLDMASLIDAANYQLTTVHHPRVGKYRFNVITDVPGTTTGTQTVTLTVNGGKPIAGGWYFFTIISKSSTDVSGVEDIAGNALDGEFYGYLPSGNNIPGGNFVAQLTAIHHTVFAPSTVVGRATPVSPPGTRAGDPHHRSDPPTKKKSKSIKVVHHTDPALQHLIQQVGSRPVATGKSEAVGSSSEMGSLGILDQALNQVGTSGKHRKS